MRKVLLIFGISLVGALSACKVTDVVKVPPVAIDSVTSIQINPQAFTISVGRSQIFTATLKNASGATVIGNTVTWSSSNTSVATVSNQGIVTGISVGGTIITATTNGISASAAVAVTNIPVATILLTPSSGTMFVGQSTIPRVELRGPSDELLTNRFVEWSSSNTAVATVNQLGMITAVSPGTATIRATSEGRVGNFTVTVVLIPVTTVSIVPPAGVFVGRSTQLTLNLRDSLGNTVSPAGRTITWSNSNSNVAFISSTGVITGTTPGSTTVAVLVDGRLVTLNLDVTLVGIDSISITPTTDSSLQVGASRQYTATAFDATGTRIDAPAMAGRTFAWTSETPAFLTVSNTGLVIGVNPGDGSIRVTSGGRTARRNVRIVP